MCDVNVSKGGDESMTDGDYQPALDISALPQVGSVGTLDIHIGGKY